MHVKHHTVNVELFWQFYNSSKYDWKLLLHLNVDFLILKFSEYSNTEVIFLLY